MRHRKSGLPDLRILGIRSRINPRSVDAGGPTRASWFETRCYAALLTMRFWYGTGGNAAGTIPTKSLLFIAQVDWPASKAKRNSSGTR
jgi:hypothetical protein